MNEKIIDACEVCGSFKRIGINQEEEYWCGICKSKFKKTFYGFGLVTKNNFEKEKKKNARRK